MKGKASIEFEHPPVIISAGSVVGKKEGEGPLGSLFDEVELDDMFGMDNWEQAESTMQKKTADLVIEKGGIRKGDLRYLFEEEDGSFVIDLAGDYYGEIDFQMQYKDILGESFDWLYIDFQTLSLYAAENGFQAELVKEGKHYDYLAKLTLK